MNPALPVRTLASGDGEQTISQILPNPLERSLFFTINMKNPFLYTENYNHGIIVLCPTNDLAFKFFKILEKHPHIKWVGGDPIKCQNTYWTRHEAETAYVISLDTSLMQFGSVNGPRFPSVLERKHYHILHVDAIVS